jgi:aryl-alcohol dehydrogenase (NADP+)
MGDGANDLGLSRRHLRRALDDSLRRLGVEHIDLYQMHAWDAVTPLEETLRFLDDAVTAGKISYYASPTTSAGRSPRRSTPLVSTAGRRR